MPIPLIVGLITIGAIVLVGAIGYLIDSGAERHDRLE